MRCPYCGHNEDRVLDTREQKEGDSIRRRRECLGCKTRFSTVETLSVSYPMVIKKDGRREPFNREKVLHGLQAACQKRPISLAQLDAVVERISLAVLQRAEKEISAFLIGRMLMRELKNLDDVAYVRFASVYRSFKDLQEFVETLEDHDDEATSEFAGEPTRPIDELAIELDNNSSAAQPERPLDKGI